MAEDLLIELLKENFPIECETAGTTNLKDIVNANVEFQSAEHGSYLDLSSTITTLVVATTFIKTVIDIYTSLRKELGREPGENEIEIRIVSPKDMKLDKAARKCLINSVVYKLKKEFK